MSEQNQTNTPHDHKDKDRGQMASNILQGLILAGILWVGSSLNSQNTSITKLQVQIETLQALVSGVPGMNDRITKLEANQVQVMRRQDITDAWRDRMQSDNYKMKGWQR